MAGRCEGHQCNRQFSERRRREIRFWEVCLGFKRALSVIHADLYADLHFSAGTFRRPLFAADGIICNGVETTDGTKYFSDKVILAAGAWSPTLVDLEDQCVSKVSRAY